MKIWKDIDFLNNEYQVNKEGKIRSKDRYHHNQRYPGKTLSPFTTKEGYERVIVSTNGKSHKYFVHQLVAKAFIPNPHNYTQVNHKDENKKNNCVENLEWCNRSYNMKYGTNRERSQITKIKLNRNNKRKKIKVTFPDNSIKIYNSIAETENKLKIPKGSVSRYAHKQITPRNGYIYDFI